jgi:hypothetical protein
VIMACWQLPRLRPCRVLAECWHYIVCSDTQLDCNPAMMYTLPMCA